MLPERSGLSSDETRYRLSSSREQFTRCDPSLAPRFRDSRGCRLSGVDRVAFVIAVWIGGVASAAAPLDPTVLFRRASESVVVVVAQTKGRISQGSGVVIGRGRVVTNRHVVEGAATGHIAVKQGDRVWHAEVFRVGAGDLAILDVLMKASEPFDLPAAPRRHIESLEVGERVYAIGAPRGLEQTLSEGLVSGILRDTDPRIVQTTAAISPGSSGGGLFDSRGNLIGITTLYLRESQSLNFAIAASAIDGLLKSAPQRADRARKIDEAFDGAPNRNRKLEGDEAWEDFPEPVAGPKSSVVPQRNDIDSEKPETADDIVAGARQRIAALQQEHAQHQALKERLYTSTPSESWSSKGWQELRWGMGSRDVMARLRFSDPPTLMPNSNTAESSYDLGKLADKVLGYWVWISLSFRHGRLVMVSLTVTPDIEEWGEARKRWCAGAQRRFQGVLTEQYGEGDCRNDPHPNCYWRAPGMYVALRNVPRGQNCAVYIDYAERK